MKSTTQELESSNKNTKLLSATRASMFCWFSSSGRSFSDASIFSTIKWEILTQDNIVVQKMMETDKDLMVAVQFQQKNCHCRKTNSIQEKKKAAASSLGKSMICVMRKETYNRQNGQEIWTWRKNIIVTKHKKN